MAAEQSHTRHNQTHLAVNEEGKTTMRKRSGRRSGAAYSLTEALLHKMHYHFCLSFAKNTRTGACVLEIYVALDFLEVKALTQSLSDSMRQVKSILQLCRAF